MTDIKCFFEQKTYWILMKEVNYCENQSFKLNTYDLKQWDAIWLNYDWDQ